VASEPSRCGRPTGGGTRALPGPLRGTLRPSGAGAHDQRPVTAQPGADAADAGGLHRPQPGGAAVAGDALAMEQPKEWDSGRRYLDMELLEEVSAPAAPPVAQAA
jgi:hypothetical protein